MSHTADKTCFVNFCFIMMLILIIWVRLFSLLCILLSPVGMQCFRSSGSPSASYSGNDVLGSEVPCSAVAVDSNVFAASMDPTPLLSGFQGAACVYHAGETFP